MQVSECLRAQRLPPGKYHTSYSLYRRALHLDFCELKRLRRLVGLVACPRTEHVQYVCSATSTKSNHLTNARPACALSTWHRDVVRTAFTPMLPKQLLLRLHLAISCAIRRFILQERARGVAWHQPAIGVAAVAVGFSQDASPRPGWILQFANLC